MPWPSTITLDVWAGNDEPYEFNFVNESNVAIDLTGATLVFRATWPGGTLRFTTSDPELQIVGLPTAGRVRLNLTTAQTASLPLGNIALFEIERRIGSDQKTLVAGSLNVGYRANDNA